MPKRGKLIVIDGTDGSGKATQTHLLVERLRKENYPVKMVDFPQFGKKSCGPVEEYLNGHYGTSEEVGPYKASILYAVDRFDASFEIREKLETGVNIICNRYVSSNMGHQAGKIHNRVKRKKFLTWLYELEYEYFEIPRPDLNIILHVPSELAYKLAAKKRPRKYLEGNRKHDIHEADKKHLNDAEQAYLDLAKTFQDFKKIECMDQTNKMLSPEKIHELIWRNVVKILRPKEK